MVSYQRQGLFLLDFSFIGPAPQSAEEDPNANVPIGSVAAGGRYDKLVGMFLNSGGGKKKEADVPCVGISFGIERLFTMMEMKYAVYFFSFQGRNLHKNIHFNI